MCEVVSLAEYKKSLEQKKIELEVDFLYKQVDEIMDRIGEL